MCSAGENFSSVAIYHFKVKVINRRAGPGAVGSAAYRAGERIRDEKSGQVFNYQRRKGIVYTEIISPRTAPDWVSDRATLWNTVELAEKRKDAQLAREIMVALPKELDQGQQIRLVRGYLNQHFIKKGMIADYAIHAPSKGGDDRNHHAHILLSMRNITQEGFGGKVREWNAKSNIYQWRQAWENCTNQALAQAGLDCRVDCRSHAAKGLDREPLRHLGYQVTAMERRGEPSDLGNENRAIVARNAMRAKLRELDEINGEIGKILQGKSEQKAGIKTPETVTNLAGSTLAVLELSHDNQQQATPPTNEIPLSANNTLNADNDNIFVTQKIQIDLSLNQPDNQQETIKNKEELSLKERKNALDQKAEAFKEWQEKLQLLIENYYDEKTQDRLRLETKLVSSDFIRTYKKALAGILAEEDHRENAKSIVVLKHEARKAEQDYKKYAAKWDLCAVRDDDYKPKNERSANKIDKMKKTEEKRWAKFEDKVKANGWSLDKIERERQNLQSEMDLQLDEYFGLNLNRCHDMGMGM
jgi:hypothetical protein